MLFPTIAILLHVYIRTVKQLYFKMSICLFILYSYGLFKEDLKLPVLTLEKGAGTYVCTYAHIRT